MGVREMLIGVLCFFLWVPAPVSGYGAGPAGMTAWGRCHPHPSPLPSRERGCQSVCLVFLWVPACAGMTGGA